MKKKKRAAILVFMCCALFLHADPNTWYVDVNSPQDGPGDTPETAWRVIQDAIDNASAGDTILVAPGVYDQGGRYYTDAREESHNRILVNKQLFIIAISTNPADTLIVGAPDPDTGGAGANAYRAARLGAGSLLSGFTITNGYAGVGLRGRYGGGVFLRDSDTVISNCVFVGNWAADGVVGLRDFAAGSVHNSVFIGTYSGIALSAYSITI